MDGKELNITSNAKDAGEPNPLWEEAHRVVFRR